MDQEKLHRFATNSSSDQAELESVIRWIEEDEANQKEFNRVKNLHAFAYFKNFDQLSNSIFEQEPKTSVRGKLVNMQLLKYAAVFLLAFLVGGVSIYFMKSSIFLGEVAQNKIIVPFGESAEVILSDNTHVWLNSGAKMEYPETFASDHRGVKLSGEAYFEVTHNEDKPFQVVTSSLSVNVLGTSFNVEAFENSPETNVTLVKGKVNLENSDGKVIAVLKPSQNALYSTQNKQLDITNVNTSFYTSWKDGTLNFKEEELEYIAEKLERWFNVDIVFDDEIVKQMKFTGSVLKNKPIDQILDILKFTSNVDYSIEMKNENPNIIHLKKMPM